MLGKVSDTPETVDLDGEVKRETANAWLFFDGVIETWLPKSLCEWDQDAKRMTAPVWLAEDRGLV